MDAAPDAAYWRRHTREPVQFGDGMAAVAALDCQAFLEVGPHPVLLPLAQACLAGKSKVPVMVGSLNRQKSDGDATAEMLAALFRAGVDVDWAAVYAENGGKRIALPTYPFQRKRYWLDAPRRETKPVEPEHPLIGTPVAASGNVVMYEARYSLRELGSSPITRCSARCMCPRPPSSRPLRRLRVGISRRRTSSSRRPCIIRR